MVDLNDAHLPPLLPYPSATVQQQLLPEEWKSCMDLWVASVALRLAISDEKFAKLPVDQLGSNFLLSYLTRCGTSNRERSLEELKLNKSCFRLVSRILGKSSDHPGPQLSLDLLYAASVSYHKAESWKKTLRDLWKVKQIRIKKAIELAVSSLSTSVEIRAQLTALNRISTLTKSLPEVATLTVAGADYLDNMTELYTAGSDEVKKAVTENMFYSLIALLSTKRTSILTDDLYHIKSDSDRSRISNPDTTTVLSSLLCSTSFLKHLSADPEITMRKQTLLDQLTQYRQDMLHLHPISPRRTKKGKERAKPDSSMHMHQATQVSQIHELFPDLSTTFVLKALDAYDNDSERTIAALLEPDTLPKELRDQNTASDEPPLAADTFDLEPRSHFEEEPPSRKSVFDNDEFDQLSISTNQIRRGKKDMQDDLQSANQHASSKAAILSALATFDSDDDERDDTYDIADVGGAVDNTVDSDERRTAESDLHEGALYRAWKETPDLFARDSKTRASNIRQQLKRETGMADEQIEAWAIMLNKDKKQQDRLQDKYSASRAFSGSQRALQATKWQASASTENSETESGPERSSDTRRMGQAGIRGHRNFERGRGRGAGSTSGPGTDTATQQARKRKEQGRGRGGANHRRDARAKKVGRGMGQMPLS